MTRPADQPQRDTADGRRGGLLTRLAGAGRWMGEPQRQRGWEDYLADFLAALLVWGGIGWLADRWLGTAPWLMIAGIVLGNALGIYMLWLHSEQQANRSARDRSDRARAPGDRSDSTRAPGDRRGT